MAVKYRIEYCNKSNDTARLDIDVRGYSGQVYPIEGTGDLFLLEYKRTDDYILSTAADIQIFSDENFNIDILKTTDETELKALFYVNNVLKWQGYILPDFFQTGISGSKAISMTATDRLSVLKDVALDYSLEKLSYAHLIARCLEKTGLSMNFNVVADFMISTVPSTFHIMNCYVDHARITNRNKSLSAYDVLRSILVLLNAQIVQYGGEWWIVNRYQLRNGGGRVFKYLSDGTYNSQGTFTPSQIPFTYVEADGMRSVEPVISQSSVFMEFGGVRRYPEDYEFRHYNNGYNGWTAVNGFNISSYDKEIIGYTASKTPITNNKTVRPRMMAVNSSFPWWAQEVINLETSPHLVSSWIPLIGSDSAEIELTANITGLNYTSVPIAIVVDTKRDTPYTRYMISLKEGGFYSFKARGVRDSTIHRVNIIDESIPSSQNKAVTATFSKKITINAKDLLLDSLAGAEVQIMIFSIFNIIELTENYIPTYFNEISITASTPANGNGVLFRTDQGGGSYSKKSDADTTIFGDHLSQGLNGFFYAYPQDELSIHSYLGSNIRTGWISPDDSVVDPILLHSVRQRARINSIAKSILNITFSEAFNPLAVYTCGGKSYVPRAGRHDFLRTRTEIELEENASQPLTKVDYIYTYFGDEKEKGITTLSGISGGGSSGGSESHTHNNKDIIDQLSQVNLDVLSLLEIDENDNLKVNTNLYSTGEVSAYGIGSTGGGGGGGSTVAWGTEAAGSVPLTVEGVSKTLSLASHTHSGYLTEETDPTVPDHVKAITLSNITNWNAYGSQAHSHLNKSLLDTYTQTEVNLADAVSKKHSHTNKSILDATTASFLTADRTKLDGIAAGAQVNVQANWDAVSGAAAILNKPSSLPASDVYAWAKASTKPSYTASEIGGLGANYRWLTDAYIATWNAKEPAITKGTTAQYFRGDMSLALFPTALPASDVSAWAKASTKPSYIASEIGGLGTNYRWLTDTYIATWNAKEPAITKLTAFNKNFGTTAGTVAEGNHTHTKSQVGLSNVDNTSDVNKPISTATQTALNGKSNIGHTHNLSEIGITGLTTNYLTKFNGSTLVNSQIFDNGANVGIDTTNPTSKLEVNGAIKSSALYVYTEITANDYIQSNGAIYALTEIQSPKYKLGNGWDIRASGTELQFFYNAVKKGGFSTNGFYSTGEVTAFN